MTQERYQEAAEWHEKWRKSLTGYLRYAKLPDGHPERMRTELAIRAHAVAVETLSKLAFGWVLVPGEPTPEILQAMHDGPLCASEYQMDEKAKAWLIDMYNAAIAAAPKP